MRSSPAPVEGEDVGNGLHQCILRVGLQVACDGDQLARGERVGDEACDDGIEENTVASGRNAGRVNGKGRNETVFDVRSDRISSGRVPSSTIVRRWSNT